MQEAWLRAARGLGGFAWRSSLRTWLLGIVVHRCREEWRRRPADGALEELDGAGPPVAPPAVATRVDLERAAAALAADRRDQHRSVRHWLGWAAALVLAAGAGFLAGQGTGRPPGPAPADESYLLLLHAPPAGTPVAPEADVVAELRAWAGELRRGGHLLGAEKLRDDGWRLAGAAVVPLPPAGAADRAGGYFLLRAASAAEALRLAASCPLLRHGGRLELRPVDPT